MGTSKIVLVVTQVRRKETFLRDGRKSLII